MAENQDPSSCNFDQILCLLLSLDNDIRTKAEDTFNAIPGENKIIFLLQSVTNRTIGVSEKQLACVLMRRLITNEFKEFYPKLDAESQRQLKECVLMLVQTEANEMLRRKVCDVVAELSRCLIDDEGCNNWPEILQFLFRCANSTDAAHREAALRIFATVPGIFGRQQHEYLTMIKEMLRQSLEYPVDPKVRGQAVRAICAFTILHEKEEGTQKNFQDLLPGVIKVLAENMYSGAEDDSVIKSFIDLCESSPKFLKPQITNLLQVCIEVICNMHGQFDDEMRHYATEIVVTLCEVGSAMMRKEASSFVPSVVKCWLTMMADIEDDYEWPYADEIVDDDTDSNNVIAESALDRMSCGLGGKSVLQHVIAHVPTMLADSNWKSRHAALMAISAVGEGCHKQMEPMLDNIMDGILLYLKDQHPRVRYAACNAVGQMSSDFAPTLQKNFHQKIIPLLLLLLDDNLNPRVQAHAGAALVNFAEDCPKVILVQYLDAIMQKLESVLNNKFKELVEKGTKLVLEQIVTTIASVADTAEEQFISFYDRLMPSLKYIIENAVTPELRQLRGKTLECVSLIGLAVGREKFFDDAIQVMDMLLRNHQEHAEGGNEEALFSGDSTDTYQSYMISAWARICIVLGRDFERYLPLVMGPVMKAAAMKPELALFDNDDIEEMDRKQDSINNEWQFISLGEQQNFGIRTSGLEEKVAACEMLVCYARELKEGFAEYAERVLDLMIPMLKFYFHDGVRTAAAQSLSHLLTSVKIKGPDYVNGMWNFICPELLAAIKGDPENDVVGDLFAAMAKCIEVMGKGCLTEERMNELVSLFQTNLLEHLVEEEQLLENKKIVDEIDDDSAINELIGDDELETTYKISKLADVVQALFKVYGTEFYPFFDRILPHFAKMLEANQRWTDNQWAICVFDDLIEYTGSQCKKYEQYFLPPMATYLTHKRQEVRQACCYGFGVLAMYGGPEYSQTCASAVETLLKLVNDSAAKSQDNLMVTENAVSALAKIFKYNSALINVDQLLPHWLTGLPVLDDSDEVPYVYEYLCDLIENNNPVILGDSNSNLINLLAVMGEVFLNDAIELKHPVAKRMAIIIKQIEQKSNEVFQNYVMTLNESKRQKMAESLNAIA